MKTMAKRVVQLEQHVSDVRRHVVLWCRGHSFDEALERSVWPPGANERLLIEMVSVRGGHGEPVIPIEQPEWEGERRKACAWAGGD